MWTDLARWIRSLRGGLLAVGIVLVAAVGGGYVGYSTTEPYYVTQGAVVVLPPGAGNPDAGQNPFANLYNSTQFTAVVATNIRSEATRDRVAAASGARRDYIIETVAREVRANFAQNAAQIEYTINGPDAGAAERGAEALTAAVREAVRTIQLDSGVPAPRLAQLQVTVPAPMAHQVTGGLVIAALTDAGIAALLAAAALVMWRLLRRARADRVRSSRPRDRTAAEPEVAGATSD